MTTLDYAVLIGYFLLMSAIGIWSMLKIQKQEDFFLGGRSFGRIMQAFAAFGAGTGSNDPVTLGKTVFTSGLSGIWSVLLWLFVTPFYWIFGVWYRRMRHLTLGDWFVERYQSPAMGAAYTAFAIVFYMVYLGVGFTAVGKVCVPLMGSPYFDLPGFSDPVKVEYVLVPIIALVVAVYGVLGGLRAAYWTDLIQGIFIILLSVILIPVGLNTLVERKGDPEHQTMIDGFTVMHEQVPKENFQIVGSVASSEFPFYYILAITVINMVGIVVQPHFIATGGGSAKSENAARVGLVSGNFMKRFCTVGWALTALIVLALFANNPEINADPDQAWGIASRELLGPLNLGLVGLMLACLLAALMSSADCYMLVSSALVVRNVWNAYIDKDMTEKQGILAGRITGALIIIGGTLISLTSLNVFGLLKVTWELPILFAAPFWIGMFWRKATPSAAWLTVLFSALVFFILPMVLPEINPALREMPALDGINEKVVTTVERPAAPADVEKRTANIESWDKKNEAGESVGDRPQPLKVGDPVTDTFSRGGNPIFWTDGVKKIDDDGNVVALTSDDFVSGDPVEVSKTEDRKVIEVRSHLKEGLKLQGQGFLNLDFLLYEMTGVNLETKADSVLNTFRLPPRVIAPFLVMFLLSLFTPKQKGEALDRYYVKMKTPVEPNHEDDEAELAKSYEDPARYDHRKLLPGSSWEFQRPTVHDVVGFVISFIVCFVVIGIAVWVAQIGS